MVSSQQDKATRVRFCRRRGLSVAKSGVESSSVPTVLLEPVARRLRFAAGAAAVLWVAYLALALAAGALTRLSVCVGVLAILSSAALVSHTMRAGADAARLQAFGSAYLLLTALALAVAQFSTPGSLGLRGEVAWSAIWITLFPLLIACAPRQTLIRALVAASMSPIAFFLIVPAATRAEQSPMALILLFAPIYLAALLAHAASQVLSGLGAQLADAASMGMYELESRIALGGMGEVWRARHRLLSRPAAVKLIRTRAADAPNSVTPADSVKELRFEREAQVTACLKSPHTVELYDFGVTESGTIYYVMELLEGGDLEQLVKREGPLEPARVVHILEQTLDSLAEAHQLGLVHRDIKPANLHISRRGLENDFVKVLDFGLVKNSRRNSNELNLTSDGGVLGTPAYLAPEVITGDRPVDARADLYSLGCVAYYLLTGTLVFEAETPMAMAIAHATESPVPPSERTQQAIPADLERIVLQCLEKSPDDRPANAIELLRQLRELDLELGPRGLQEIRALPTPPIPSSAFN